LEPESRLTHSGEGRNKDLLTACAALTIEAIAKFTLSSFPDLIGESSLFMNQCVMDSGFRRNDEWS
ncbi:MAG: hypothetical protein COX16_11745, partial [Deltaproteobacteria bacterium CG23_combo_of_CG06-09_8_20_14_all_51_20]